MTDKQRQAFEAFADDRNLSTQTNPRYGGYILADTARAWEAWTASRKLALEEAAQIAEANKFDGYVAPENGAAAEYYDEAGRDIAAAIRQQQEEGK